MMNRSELFPVITVPLFPYIKPGCQAPVKTKRIRPRDSLDLGFLVDELEACRITTLDIGGNPWSLISVYSPYSADIHVMVMETSTVRYLPSPERIPDEEGEAVVRLWSHITSYLRKRPNAKRVFVGYNWSPRSWGDEEEKTGFQSIPTKWHPMIWSWPEFPPAGENSGAVSWIEADQLNPSSRRLFGINNNLAILLDTMREQLLAVLDEATSRGFGINEIKSESSTVTITIEKRLDGLLKSPGFFSKLLKPMAGKLNELMAALTESFTDMDCMKVDALIESAIETYPNENAIQNLRKQPRLKSKDEIFTGLEKHDLPASLVDELYEPIRSRCKEAGDSNCWWRKGFGYALVIGDGPNNNETSHLKIMPGVYLGPGGVVEAQGVILQRPEDRTISENRIRKKSSELYQLQNYIDAL